jgi:hypothetical protein
LKLSATHSVKYPIVKPQYGSDITCLAEGAARYDRLPGLDVTVARKPVSIAAPGDERTPPLKNALGQDCIYFDFVFNTL